MYIQRFNLVVPVDVEPTTHLLAADATKGEHGKLQVYSGSQAVKNYGVSVVGSGATASGTIKGSITTFDYKALYSIYKLEDSVDAHYWFVHYSKDTSHDELKKTFESSQKVTTKYDLNFTLQGNDYGITSVFITYQVIRMVIDGETKDYVVTNSNRAGAASPDGSSYPGKFTPVSSGS